jgi:hypothetical protein
VKQAAARTTRTPPTHNRTPPSPRQPTCCPASHKGISPETPHPRQSSTSSQRPIRARIESLNLPGIARLQKPPEAIYLNRRPAIYSVLTTISCRDGRVRAQQSLPIKP